MCKNKAEIFSCVYPQWKRGQRSNDIFACSPFNEIKVKKKIALMSDPSNIGQGLSLYTLVYESFIK